MCAAATSTQLRLAGVPRRRRLPATAWSDMSLLAFLLALHALPLVALAAGRSWGVGAEGYATVVVLVGGVELGRELRDHLRPGDAREERHP